MKKQEAVAILVLHNSQRRMFLGETGTSEAIDLAIEALRESAEPAELSRERHSELLIAFAQWYNNNEIILPTSTILKDDIGVYLQSLEKTKP